MKLTGHKTESGYPPVRHLTDRAALEKGVGKLATLRHNRPINAHLGRHGTSTVTLCTTSSAGGGTRTRKGVKPGGF